MRRRIIIAQYFDYFHNNRRIPMTFNRIIDWLDASDCATGKSDLERGRAELARLGLMSTGPEDVRRGDRSFRPVDETDGHDYRSAKGLMGKSLSKPINQVTRLAVLLGAGTIASLAMIFG